MGGWAGGFGAVIRRTGRNPHMMRPVLSLQECRDSRRSMGLMPFGRGWPEACYPFRYVLTDYLDWKPWVIRETRGVA